MKEERLPMQIKHNLCRFCIGGYVASRIQHDVQRTTQNVESKLTETRVSGFRIYLVLNHIHKSAPP